MNLIKLPIFKRGLHSLLIKNKYLCSTQKPSVTIQDFKKIEIRVGKITQCTVNPNSDKLYLQKVDISEKTLQIGSKLAKVLPPSELLAGFVLVIANMKPRKLAGIPSQGMILAIKDEKDTKLLRPPSQAQAGQRVYLEGQPANSQKQPVLNPKKKILQDCLENLKVQEDLSVTFLGKKLIVGEGLYVKSDGLKGKIS